MKGTVTKLYGKGCIVATDPPAREQYECYLRGRLFENPDVQFAVGDRVEFDPVETFHHTGASGDKDRLTGVIHEVLPRRSALTRPAKRKEKKPQLIAANVDQLVIVSALKRPQYKTGLVDRYLIVAHRTKIEAALCLNKIDLGKASDLEKARADLKPYQDLGFPIVWTCAKTGEGCDELSALLKDKRSVLVGHSGVGKSKLAGRMQPGAKLASSTVRRSGKGRHTTSVSTLIQLDFGGELVDTPGVRELGVVDLSRKELARHFVEFEPLLGSCKFKSCSHIPEPGCAVKEAVESGSIHRARHESYENLYHELTSAGRR
jgi:ribosome biogenesis GTPase